MGYIPFETCQPYLACSEESEEGFCPQIDTSCTMINTCRTCSGFSDSGGHCVELPYFPNATVAEWGEIGGSITPKEQTHKIKAEIFARGPVACTINADPLRNYPMKDDGSFWEGGVLDDEEASQSTNHIVSITGWGKDEKTGKDYWIIRNSWVSSAENEFLSFILRVTILIHSSLSIHLSIYRENTGVRWDSPRLPLAKTCLVWKIMLPGLRHHPSPSKIVSPAVKMEPSVEASHLLNV